MVIELTGESCLFSEPVSKINSLVSAIRYIGFMRSFPRISVKHASL